MFSKALTLAWITVPRCSSRSSGVHLDALPRSRSSRRRILWDRVVAGKVFLNLSSVALPRLAFLYLLHSTKYTGVISTVRGLSSSRPLMFCMGLPSRFGARNVLINCRMLAAAPFLFLPVEFRCPTSTFCLLSLRASRNIMASTGVCGSTHAGRSAAHRG